MKICTSCNQLLPLSSFGNHKLGKDGLRSRCKPCEVAKNAEYRKTIGGRTVLEEYRKKKEVKEAIHKAHIRWAQSEKGRSVLRDLRIKHALQLKARAKVAAEILQGRIQKHPCLVCGSIEKIEAHHPDYRKPLYVVWLCKKHHTEVHLKLSQEAA